MEQNGDKRHDATPYRREQARRQGQVPKSQDLISATLLIAGLLILMYFGESISKFFGRYAVRQFSAPWIQVDADAALAHGGGLLVELGKAMMPLFGLLLLTAVGSNLGQVGIMFLPEKLGFDWKRISPMKGVGRVLSISNVMRLAFGIFKILIIVLVAAWGLWNERMMILNLYDQETLKIGIFLVRITLSTCLKIGVALFILALLDYLFQRWKFEQDLKMTDQEMREEMKMLQGDPQIAARRRAVQRQLVLNRMSSIVPTADVVVTNPTELAVAIKYDMASMEAPVVIAKGAGVLARRIRRLALENDVPIVERKELARALYKEVEVNETVPGEQYAAVAEVLRYVYDLKGVQLPGAA